MKPLHVIVWGVSIVAVTAVGGTSHAQTSAQTAGPGSPEASAVANELQGWSKRTGVILTETASAYIHNAATAAGGSTTTTVTGGSIGGGPVGAVVGGVQSSTGVVTGGLIPRLNLNVIGPALEALPTVKIVVKPVPPRDFEVNINGKNYPATEKALYGVAPGTVAVTVTRKGRRPCVWNGTVVSGAEQEVSCRL